MKKLDRFILKAFIGPFIGILAVVVFVLMMQFLWLYIDELVGKGLSLGVVLEFMMWGGCTILPLSLPLASLLASMMTLGQMGENNELMAMKAAGVGIWRVMTPIMVASIFISIGAFFVGNDLVPKAYNEIFTLRDDISKTKNEIKIPAGVFYDGIDGYILRVDGYSETGMMQDVMVYDHTANKGNNAVTVADSASMVMSSRKDYLVFTMYNGYNYQETTTLASRDTVLDLQKVNFARQQLVIPLKNYSFEKSDSSRFGDQAKSMRLNQLGYQSDSLRTNLLAGQSEHYTGLARSIALVQHNQLDTAFDRSSKQLFKDEMYRKWTSLDQQESAYRLAGESVDRAISTLTTYEQDDYSINYYLRRTDIELLKKFAQALACFILFFVGAPLGALIRKGGLGTSAIVSVLFFVLYWVIDISGTKLARDGAVGAPFGVFISAAILLPIGIYMTNRAMHDSDIFNMDSLKSKWRLVRSKVAGFFRKTRIVYMGTPEFAVAPLAALIKSRHKIVGVVTVADKPSGRGLKVNESAVKQYAVAHGIPVLQPVKLKDPEFLKQLASLKADLFVVVAFRMLPSEVWSMPKMGTFNLHAALLPQYRGAAPINWAVINGERMTGVTTFMIDKDIDTGGIILREEYRIAPDATAGDVHDALMELGSELVVRTVEGIERKEVETRVQRSFIQGSEVLRSAPKLTRELCHIDWNAPTSSIYNLIRGLSPYPTAFTELVKDGSQPLQLKIFKAEKMEASAPAGTVLSDGRSYLAIATADGAISITELQISGKKRMDVRAFLLGFREPQSWSTTPGTSSAEIAKTK